MADIINPIPTARAIAPNDTGYVTADMLYAYLEATQQNNITGGSVNWDVDSINIKSRGRNILSVGLGGGIQIGNALDMVTIKADSITNDAVSNLYLYSGGLVSARGQWIKADASSYVDLYGRREATLRSDSVVKVFGTSKVNIKGGDGPQSSAAGRSVTITGENVRLEASNEVGVTALSLNTYSPNVSMRAQDMSMESTKLSIHGSKSVSINTHESPLSLTSGTAVNIEAKKIDMKATEITQHK